MNSIGLIVEYNPFHNGHLYHLKEAGKAVPGAPLICVMSGNWVQRGEPAVFGKWARARMALKGGVDLVLELPLAFSLQSADRFAYGAVKTLAGCGVVRHLCFGSELGNIEPLKKIAALLAQEPPGFRALLREGLDRGLSYPAALCLACAGCLEGEETPGILSSPNNILGVEYLKNLLKAAAPITPFTIPRKGAGYHSLELTGSIASATAIRRGLKEGDQGAHEAMPLFSSQIIAGEVREGRGPVFKEALEVPLMALLRRSSLQELAALPDMEEGLAQRFQRSCRTGASLEDFLARAATKRYTLSRLQRILCYLYLGITRKDLESFNRRGPRYLRVLGFSPRGRQVLRRIKEEGRLPLVTRPARYFRHSRDATGKKMLALDVKGGDLYSLLYPGMANRTGGSDYTRSPWRGP